MRALSMRDELTGLHNRRAFQMLAEQQLRQAKRFRQGLSVLFADIDGLKAINDRHGHAEGDRAIAAVADVLRHTFRDSDVVARLGGDEFVVLIPDGAPSSVEAAQTRVRERLDELNARGQLRAHLSVSFGLAMVEDEAEASVDEIVARADHQLYVQKRLRRAAAPTTRASLLVRAGRRARFGRARLTRGRPA
jgi:diguanylate cyclase (GGDEF)-like protein